MNDYNRRLHLRVPTGDDAHGAITGWQPAPNDNDNDNPATIDDAEKKNEKSVRFSPVTRVTYVPHLTNIPDDELTATYHTPEDARRIEAEMVGSIRAHRRGLSDRDEDRPEDDDHGGDTIRGLEHMASTSELRRKKAIREGCIDAVLAEQSRQRLLGCESGGDGGGCGDGERDDEALAAVSARASAAAHDLALELGAKDALYVLRCVVLPSLAIDGGARLSMTRQGSISKNVLARIGALDLNNSVPSLVREDEEESDRRLTSNLGHALEINASGPALPPPPPRRARSSQGSSLRRARLSREVAPFQGQQLLPLAANLAPPFVD